jgi:hypothetical protein
VLLRIRAWRSVFQVRHVFIVLVAVVAEHMRVSRIIVIFDLGL